MTMASDKHLGAPRSNAANNDTASNKKPMPNKATAVSPTGLEAGAPRSAPRNVPGKQSHKGWYKYGNLPHYDIADAYQSITYRLADSLPKTKLDQLADELKNVIPDFMKTERRKKIEKWLDAGFGSCALRNPDYAKLVIDSWKHFNCVYYDLIAWVVMPNLVHLFARFHEGRPLGMILNSWKTFTAHRIDLRNPRLPGSSAADFSGEKPKTWQDEY